MYNDLKNISRVKKEFTDNRNQLAEELFKNAVSLIEKFMVNKNISTLKEAGDNLVNVIQYNDEHVGAYICSSYIFYVLENNQLALDYLEKAEKILPNIKNLLASFKSKLLENKISYIQTKVVVSKESNFWKAMKKLF
ncbi:MAG: hypothetical protein KatS3mg068_2212 [Candidatus Sericytochromatia bacterium]|nr:MAG: hypothetical protein KatS3mg068_2212 [Candidatus Sericytochromatia bacterium]